MAKNGKNIESDSCVSEKTLRNILRNQRVADAAVHKAQEENRRLGIPNWYSIDGKIVSDIQLANEKLLKNKD
jgi:hypothetical protein